MKMMTLSMFYALFFTVTNAGERISEIISKDSGPGYTRYLSLLRIPGTATIPRARIIHAHAMFDHIRREYSGSSHIEHGDRLCVRLFPIVGEEAANKFYGLEARYTALQSQPSQRQRPLNEYF